MANIPNSSLIAGSVRNRLSVPHVNERGNHRTTVFSGSLFTAAPVGGGLQATTFDEGDVVGMALFLADAPAWMQVYAATRQAPYGPAGTPQLSDAGLKLDIGPGDGSGLVSASVGSIVVTTPGSAMVPSRATVGPVANIPCWLVSATIPTTGWLQDDGETPVGYFVHVAAIANGAVPAGPVPFFSDIGQPGSGVSVVLDAALLTADIYRTRLVELPGGDFAYVVGVYSLAE